MSSNSEGRRIHDSSEILKAFETHPAFAKEIDPFSDDPAVAALQALKYESEDPNANATSYKEEGNYHYGRKEFSKAIDSYTAGLNGKPTDPKLVATLFTNRAINHWYLRNYGSCIRDCKSALKADNTHQKAYLKGVDACLALDKIDECLEFCEQGLSQFPGCERLLDAQLKALRLQAKLDKENARRAREEKKEADRNEVTYKILRDRGIQIDMKLPPIDIPAAADKQFYIDVSNRIHWSVLFMYPEFGQTDFLRDVVETAAIADLLCMVFDPNQPPPSWDPERTYTCDDQAVEVFYEDAIADQKLVKLSPSWTIKQLTESERFAVRRDLLIMLHIVSRKSVKFYDRWKAEL